MPVSKIARFVTAAGLELAANSHSWLVNGARELHGGLLSFDSGGEHWTNSELIGAARDNGAQHVSAVYAPAGQVLYGLALAAAVLLVATAFIAARWIRRVTLGVIVLIFVAFGAFNWSKPGGPAFGLELGWSSLVFFIACWLGAMLSGDLPRPRR